MIRAKIDKLAQYKAVAADFSDQVKVFQSVEEVGIFASVAGNDPYPSDVDVALFLNAFCDLGRIAKIKRQLQGRTGGFDLFVFGTDRSFLGNVCFRKECPGQTRDCARLECGRTPYIEKREGLIYDPVRWFRTPIEILFHRSTESILTLWQKEIIIRLGRSEPEPYVVRETIFIKCRECGEQFEFDPGEQKHFEKMGFQHPRRCQGCRDKERELEFKTESDE
ncbi:zinc-ribbon domain containing protein [Bdellovibrionota bacterium FG-2]